MRIVVISKKPVYTQEAGRLPYDIPVDVSDALGKFLLESGAAIRMETKELIDNPTKAVGKLQQSSALQAAQASPQTMPMPSESGAKKRGRPRKEASLLSTQPIA